MITDYILRCEDISVITRARVRALGIAFGVFWLALIDPITLLDGYAEGERLYVKEHEPCNRTNTR